MVDYDLGDRIISRKDLISAYLNFEGDSQKDPVYNKFFWELTNGEVQRSVDVLSCIVDYMVSLYKDNNSNKNLIEVMEENPLTNVFSEINLYNKKFNDSSVREYLTVFVEKMKNNSSISENDIVLKQKLYFNGTGFHISFETDNNYIKENGFSFKGGVLEKEDNSDILIPALMLKTLNTNFSDDLINKEDLYLSLFKEGYLDENLTALLNDNKLIRKKFVNIFDFNRKVKYSNSTLFAKLLFDNPTEKGGNFLKRTNSNIIFSELEISINGYHEVISFQ